MIGLDTNILIRYLVQDDPVQSPKATTIFERQLSEETPGFVSVVVTVEMFWVLESYYDFAPFDIAAALERLLAANYIVFEDEQEVFCAMAVIQEGPGDFADALIAALAHRAGCSQTLTCDRKALRIPGFALA
jgi:predicted nucleic-acid-binding protein